MADIRTIETAIQLWRPGRQPQAFRVQIRGGHSSKLFQGNDCVWYQSRSMANGPGLSWERLTRLE